jgi:hypothetical protein
LCPHELARQAEELGIIPNTTDDAASDARRALRELSGPNSRLLVVDNAEDPASIIPWLPTAGGCRVLITSRCTAWPAGIHVQSIDALEPAPACNLLLSRAGVPSQTNDSTTRRLATSLGCLPLALEQAAAFVSETGVSFERYLEYLNDTNAGRG